MPQTMGQFSDEMLARYFTTYFAAWDIFRAAVNAYERRKLDPGVTMQERNDIEVKLLWLHGEHAKMMQRRTAFLSGALAINRPTKDQLEKVTALAKTADELTEEASHLSEFSAMATEASELMASMHT